MIISRTPYRISFFGGGTDFPAWYRESGGEVLSAAIDKYCYLSVRKLPPFFDHRFRIVYSKVEMCREIAEIQHPAVREVLRYLNIEEGLEIHHDGDLPGRSGIGSSSAFTVGLLNAASKLKNFDLTAHELALKSIYIEQDILKETVGCQDQIQAAYGGFNHTLFHADGNISVTPLDLPRSRTEELASHLMLFYTGMHRASTDITETYIHRLVREKNKLENTRGFVREGLEILRSGTDLIKFGELLHESWMIKSGWSSSVSPEPVQAIYESARSAGAAGGKLAGAGGGGFLLLFVPPAVQNKVREKLKGLLEVPFGFDFDGSRIIFENTKAEPLHV